MTLSKKPNKTKTIQMMPDSDGEDFLMAEVTKLVKALRLCINDLKQTDDAHCPGAHEATIKQGLDALTGWEV